MPGVSKGLDLPTLETWLWEAAKVSSRRRVHDYHRARPAIDCPATTRGASAIAFAGYGAKM